MSEFIFIGKKLSVAALRDYIITHKVDSGDLIVLNPHDYQEIIHSMKAHGEGIPDMPLTLLNVIISQDSTDTVPIGKVQVVKNEKPYL